MALRVQIAYRLGKADTFAHLHEDNFHPTWRNRPDPRSGQTAFAAWQQKHQGLVQRSKEDFVKHYRDKYGPDMPIWVAIEVWDFGAVSQLLAMMKAPDQQAIAHHFGPADWRAFTSWVRALSYLRNLVAHHSRVWNRNMVSEPKMPADSPPMWCSAFAGKRELLAKPFVYLAIVRHMVEIICPGSQWRHRLADHLLDFPVQAAHRKQSVAAMGAPERWETWWRAAPECRQKRTPA